MVSSAGPTRGLVQVGFGAAGWPTPLWSWACAPPIMGDVSVEGAFDGFAVGNVFQDGGLLRGSCAALRRGGWAVAQLTSDAQLKCA